MAKAHLLMKKLMVKDAKFATFWYDEQYHQMLISNPAMWHRLIFYPLFQNDHPNKCLRLMRLTKLVLWKK